MKAGKPKRFHKVGFNIHTVIDLIGIVLIWRGAWNIIDVYLLPGNTLLSSLVGGAIGLVVLFLDDFELKELH